MVGIIKGLRHFHLGIENLEKLVLIMKNWPKHPISRCTINSTVKSMEEYILKLWMSFKKFRLDSMLRTFEMMTNLCLSYIENEKCGLKKYSL
jgi:hypothetical protein